MIGKQTISLWQLLSNQNRATRPLSIDLYLFVKASAATILEFPGNWVTYRVRTVLDGICSFVLNATLGYFEYFIKILDHITYVYVYLCVYRKDKLVLLNVLFIFFLNLVPLMVSISTVEIKHFSKILLFIHFFYPDIKENL